MTLSIQFLTMIAMILGGFYLGIAQETYRRFAGHWKNHTFLVYFMEIIFWLSQTFILFYILFQVNSGELRFYVFVACLLGFAMYQVIAANIYKRILERLIIIAKDVYEFLAKVVTILIIRPIQAIFQALVATVLFIIGALWATITYVLTILMKPILWVLRLIYRLLPNKIHIFFNKIAGFYSKIKNICIKWIKYIASKRR